MVAVIFDVSRFHRAVSKMFVPVFKTQNRKIVIFDFLDGQWRDGVVQIIAWG